MANSWFRMYGEFAFDPKVQVLSEVMQRRYVMLLCLQCNGSYNALRDDEITLALRVTRDEWIASRNEFVSRGLLEENTFKICGWEKRQYISDLKDKTAAQRQKKYRDKKRNDRNEIVTSRPPEQIQNRTDTESISNTHTFFGKCFKALTDKFPEVHTANTSAIYLWEKAGYDFETQIKPTIEAAHARGIKLTSLQYITTALEGITKQSVKPAPVKETPVELTPERKEQLKKWKQEMGMHA